MGKKVRLLFSALFLIAPAITIYLGHYHFLLPISLLVGFCVYSIGDEYYLGKIRNSLLYKTNFVLATFLSVFSYKALKDVLDFETNIIALFEYTPFLITFVSYVVLQCIFEVKYNVKGRRLIEGEE